MDFLNQLSEFLNSLNPELQAELLMQLELIVDRVKGILAGLGLGTGGVAAYYIRKYLLLKGKNNTNEAKVNAGVEVGKEIVNDTKKALNEAKDEIVNLKNDMQVLIETNITIIKSMPISAQTLIDTGKTLNSIGDNASVIVNKLKDVIQDKQDNHKDITPYTETLK